MTVKLLADVSARQDVPPGCLRPAFKDEEEPWLDRISLAIALGDLILELTRPGLEHRNAIRSGPDAKPTPKPTRHAPQVCIIQRGERAVELAPPKAEPAGVVGEAKVGTQDNAVQAIVLSVEQIGIGATQSIGHAALIVAEPPQWKTEFMETGERLGM